MNRTPLNRTPMNRTPMNTYDASLGETRIRAVGAIVINAAGRLLVIQRGHEPAKGLWSVPGGKVEQGETDEQALRREIAEETGLLVEVGELAGSVERPGRPGVVYEIFDYDAAVVGPAQGAERDPAGGAGAGSVIPEGRAGDDAADLKWVSRAELSALPVTEGLVEALTAWGRMPR